MDEAVEVGEASVAATDVEAGRRSTALGDARATAREEGKLQQDRERDPRDPDYYDWASDVHLLSARRYSERIDEMLRFLSLPNTISVRQAVSISRPDAPPRFQQPGPSYTMWFRMVYKRRLKQLRDSGAAVGDPHLVKIFGSTKHPFRADFMDPVVLAFQNQLEQYYLAASKWLETVSNENFEAFIRVFHELPPQVREQFRVPDLRGKYATVPALPTLIPELGGRNDPQAPRLVRGWIIKSHGFLDVAGTDRKLRILSNVDYHPPLPPAHPPR